MTRGFFIVQFVDLGDSHLSGAISKFPKDELDFDPDWEIDPRDVIIMDKLGRHGSVYTELAVLIPLALITCCTSLLRSKLVGDRSSSGWQQYFEYQRIASSIYGKLVYASVPHLRSSLQS